MSSVQKFTFTTDLPFDLSWKVLKKRDEILPKQLPTLFSKVEYLEGDGGAGTIRAVTLGEAAGPGAGKTAKEHVDVVDDATHTMSYTVIEGGDPRYNDLKFTMHLTPAGDSNTTLEWLINYNPANSDVPAPTHMHDLATASIKAMDNYAKEHPSEFA